MALGNPTNFELQKLGNALNGLTKRVGAVEDQLIVITNLIREIAATLKTKGSEGKK